MGTDNSNDDTDSDNDETDSNEETDESNEGNGSADDEEEDDIDLCIDLDVTENEAGESECNTLSDDDGFRYCAINTITNDCYGITQRRGRFGSGNFDDGFIAAQTQHTQQATQLEAVIGIMGGVIAALFVVIICGGYYLYSRIQKTNIDEVLNIDGFEEDQQNINMDDDGVELIETGTRS